MIKIKIILLLRKLKKYNNLIYNFTIINIFYLWKQPILAGTLSKITLLLRD